MTVVSQMTDTLLTDFNPLDVAAPIDATRTSYADAVTDETVSFAAKIDFAAGQNPSKVISADIDGDGKRDVIVTNSYDDTVSVLRNTGNGGATSLANKIVFSSGDNPASIASGDIDNDGKLDLIIGNDDYSSGGVSILKNTSFTGAVGFASKIEVPLEDLSVAICGDVNGDDKLDLITVVNDYSNSSVSVFLNTSSGNISFAEKVDFKMGSYSNLSTLIGADINSDGLIDLVIADDYKDTISVLINTSASGTISFEQTDLIVGEKPIAIVATDVAGDSQLDLIVANQDSDTVSVLINTSSGGMSSFAQLTYAAGDTPSGVTTADVDGNGRADIIITNKNSDTVSVLKNTAAIGAVGFADKIDFITGDYPSDVTSADVNDDGKADLIVANYYDDTVSVLLNTGVGVVNANHAPTAANHSFALIENTSKTLNLEDFGFSDEDQLDTLQSITVIKLPTNGYLTLDGKTVMRNQIITATDIAAGGLVFTATTVGDANVDFKVSDGAALSVAAYTLTFAVDLAPADLEQTGTSRSDILKGTAGNDRLFGLAGNDQLKGLAGTDSLDGGVGNDKLDGGTGADSMNGGTGNDSYYVDNAGDLVVENKGGGTDTVYSALSNYTLTAEIENGSITHTGKANLTGNALNNTLFAGVGDNVIDGGAGIDIVSYANANKAVAINLALAATVIQVTGGSGNDKLINIENLTGSKFADKLTGSSLANVMNGGAGNDTVSGDAGNDVLIGGAGHDNLTGGIGRDVFRFDSLLTSNIDQIADFSVADDTIELENAVFKKLLTLGTLNANNFVANTAGVAKDANDFIVCDTDNGALFYDADGSGSGAAVQFAVIGVKSTLTAADFVVV